MNFSVCLRDYMLNFNSNNLFFKNLVFQTILSFSFGLRYDYGICLT